MNLSLRSMGFAIVSSLCLTSPALGQQFDLASGPIVELNEPVEIKLTDLPPNAEVEIRAQQTLKTYYQRGTPTLRYQSAARFAADENGRIDLATSPALQGSYSGVDPSGLFWSMVPTSSESVAADNSVLLEALIDGEVIAATSFERRTSPADYVVEAVPELPGSYFASNPEPGDHPVIIMVEGIDTLGIGREVEMPRLVAQGYSVLYLATYALVFGSDEPALPGLPMRYVDIPIDRLQDAYDWLGTQAGVDQDRVGLYGFSRNGAYVLLAATRFPWVKAVAGIAPSDVVWEGWGDRVKLGTTSSYSWKGEPLAYVPYSDNYFRETAKFARGERGRLRTPMDEGRWANPDRVASARIPLENYTGALFLSGGEQDDMWSAGHMVQNVAERRAEAGLKTDFLVLPNAGHNIIHDGWTPTMLFETGDARASEAEGQRLTWTRMLTFFRNALQPVLAEGQVHD